MGILMGWKIRPMDGTWMKLKRPFLLSNNPSLLLLGVVVVVLLLASRTRICHRMPKNFGFPNVVTVPAVRVTNTVVRAVPKRGSARANVHLRLVPPPQPQLLLLSPPPPRQDRGSQPCRDREPQILVRVVVEEDTMVEALDEVEAAAVAVDEDHKCVDSSPVPGDVGLGTVAAFLTATSHIPKLVLVVSSIYIV